MWNAKWGMGNRAASCKAIRCFVIAWRDTVAPSQRRCAVIREEHRTCVGGRKGSGNFNQSNRVTATDSSAKTRNDKLFPKRGITRCRRWRFDNNCRN